MGAVCPTCGIAVVPGYVRCPKCQAALPAARRNAPGGTSVASWHLPRVPLIAGGALVAVVVVIVVIAHHGSHAPAPTAAAAASPTAPRASAPAAAGPGDDIVAPIPASPGSTAPDPVQLANQLGADLQRQELWSTVEVVGDHVEVRSSSCRDPAMATALAQASPGFKSAGLTALRCVEQSGVVVFTHQL